MFTSDLALLDHPESPLISATSADQSFVIPWPIRLLAASLARIPDDRRLVTIACLPATCHFSTSLGSALSKFFENSAAQLLADRWFKEFPLLASGCSFKSLPI